MSFRLFLQLLWVHSWLVVMQDLYHLLLLLSFHHSRLHLSNLKYWNPIQFQSQALNRYRYLYLYLNLNLQSLVFVFVLRFLFEHDVEKVSWQAFDTHQMHRNSYQPLNEDGLPHFVDDVVVFQPMHWMLTKNQYYLLHRSHLFLRNITSLLFQHLLLWNRATLVLQVTISQSFQKQDVPIVVHCRRRCCCGCEHLERFD